MKFSVIIADPPWAPSDTLKMDDVKRGASSQYSILSTDDLCKLDIKSLADESGCVLALWVLGSMLEDGMKVMKAWGFKQKQIYVWVKIKKNPLRDFFTILSEFKTKDLNKDNMKVILESLSKIDLSSLLAFGMGRLFRQTHEVCLIGTNNNGIYKKLKNKSQRSVSFGQNAKHSQKPNHLHESFEVMFSDSSANKIEIFARRERSGWITVGNEIEPKGEDIKDSITRLKAL